jgi:hypothetical protein
MESVLSFLVFAIAAGAVIYIMVKAYRKDPPKL